MTRVWLVTFVVLLLGGLAGVYVSTQLWSSWRVFAWSAGAALVGLTGYIVTRVCAENISMVFKVWEAIFIVLALGSIAVAVQMIGTRNARWALLVSGLGLLGFVGTRMRVWREYD